MTEKKKQVEQYRTIDRVVSLPVDPISASSAYILLQNHSILDRKETTQTTYPEVYYSFSLQEKWKELPEELIQLLKRAKILDVQTDWVVDSYQDRILEYRKRQVGKWLKEREKEKELQPSYMKCDDSDVIRVGKAEVSFFNILKKKLPYCILRNQKIPIDNYYYYPDLVIIAAGLFIDIEIDEPYADEGGQPIHYYEKENGELVSSDMLRNNCLTSEGWEVIRFAEEQVVKYPEECLDLINHFINSIQEDGSKRPRMPFLNRVEKWTQSKARYYAHIKYRDKYKD